MTNWRAPLPPEVKDVLAHINLNDDKETTHMTATTTQNVNMLDPTSDADVKGFITPIEPRWVGNELTVQPFSLKGQLRGRLFPEYFTAAGVTRAHKSVPSELFLAPANLTGRDRGLVWPTLFTQSGKRRLSPERVREIKAEACKIMRERKAAQLAAKRTARKGTHVGKKVRRQVLAPARRHEPTHKETVHNVKEFLDHDALLDAVAVRMGHDMHAVTDYMRGLAERLYSDNTITEDAYYAIHYWIDFGNRCIQNFPDNVRDRMKEREEDEEASEADED